jgi:hypothetical protein
MVMQWVLLALVVAGFGVIEFRLLRDRRREPLYTVGNGCQR